MSVVGQAIVNYIGVHWEEFTAAATVLFIAAVCCLPENRPKSVDDWYAYIRHTLQTSIPASRIATTPQAHIQTAETTPTGTKTEDSTFPVAAPPPLAPPVDPAQPMK